MRLKLKGVYASHKKDRLGRLKDYYYLRGYGALRPQPGDEEADFTPGSPAFMRSYQAAIDAPRRARVTGTLQEVIDGYRKSPQFQQLAERTRSDYLGHLDKIAAAKFSPKTPAFGTYPLAVIEDPKIRKRLLDWRDEMAKSSRRQADATFGVLRIILEWARDRGMISHNHATRPKKVYKADRSDKLWLPEHLDAFREHATPELRLALELALWTGQRQSDLLQLGWSAVKDGRLTFRQGKRKRKVDMPLPAALKAVLDAAPKKATTILATDKGKPWTVKPRPIHFMHKWREVALAAGLDGLHFHDLRGTTCTMLADAGCTPSEIAAVLGWTLKTVNEMLDRYQSMTATQSDSAVAKLERKAQ
ncbi:tyrosine-type recombinase/integrase [Novosphingobium olei]|uniref:Tyrosine-type recombinase/integrase n=1 Tax=Novosphingobium olei TaxID=2728851 RepID=A0A7Y0GAB1_9SPHN|nr:site-specific integrase [Novosphingobium olei]NML93759.1 tyrosine-type recombinase/integrase [Novosphingobium olei]